MPPLVSALALASALLLALGVARVAADLRAARDARRIRTRLAPPTASRTLRRVDGDDGRLARLFALAGLTVAPARLLGGIAIAGAAGAAPLGVPAAVPVAALLAVLATCAVVALMARRRLRRFAGQLPTALDTVVRSLRAGHPVAAAIALAGREMPDPLGGEFAKVTDEMTYGLDLRQAMSNLGHRVPVAELRFLVVAVRIQTGLGGNLAEVLASLSRLMRERAKLERKVRALSAEGRLSALILSALPFLAAGAVALLDPAYYRAAWADPQAPWLLGGGVAGVVLGVLVMAAMIRPRL